MAADKKQRAPSAPVLGGNPSAFAPLRTIASEEAGKKIDAVAASGLFNRSLVLSGVTYRISEAATRAVADALASSDLAALGKAAAEVLVYDEDSRPHPLRTSFAPTMPVVSTKWPVEQMINGIVVLVGESRSGKTTWLSERNIDLLIRVSEPLETVDDRSNVLKADDFAYAIGAAFAATAAGYTVAVDSLRGMMYSLKGNTMEGGVSAGLYELLTTVNNLFASTGGTAIFAVNPMTGNADKMNVLMSRIEASVAGLILMKSGQMSGYAFRGPDGRRHASDGADELPQEQLAFTNEQSTVTHERSMLGWGREEGSRRDVAAAGLIGEVSAPDSAPRGTVFPTLHY